MDYISAYQNLKLEPSNALCIWSFDTHADPIPDSSDQVSGDGSGYGIFQIGPNANFSGSSDKGFWSGDKVLINGSDNNDSWEIFLVFDRQEKKTDILLSTRTDETGNGITFGVNDMNVPFVYSNQRGSAISRTFDKIKLTSLNAICLSKGPSEVTLSVYNPSGGWIESETINVKSKAFGDGPIIIGMDSFLTGDLPNSPYVGNIYELSVYSDGLVNTVRERLLDGAFSGYTGVGFIDGFTTTQTGEVSGVGLAEMISFERANRLAKFSHASNKFYLNETGDFSSARVFQDGEETDEYFIYKNGLLVFDGGNPNEVIYDIYITGSPQEGVLSTYTGYGELSRPKNSFYIADESGRMRKNFDFFETTELDWFHGKQMGSSSASSTNIMLSI